MWKLIRRALGWTVVALVALGALAWTGDWLLWRLHSARGRGLGSVTVSRVVVAPLKGNREEYYPAGTTEQTCSRSALPEGGLEPCWWIARHAIVWDR